MLCPKMRLDMNFRRKKYNNPNESEFGQNPNGAPSLLDS